MFRTKNEDFFRDWSADMAYVLGYFAADGTMVKNKRGAHYIEFWSTDQELIENVRFLLGSNHRIRSRIRVEHQKRIYRIQIGSKKIFEDLERLGFTSGSHMFLSVLKQRLKNTAQLNGGTLYYSGRGFHLNYSILDSTRLYNFMYTGIPEGLYLRRKKKVFEKYFDLVGR